VTSRWRLRACGGGGGGSLRRGRARTPQAITAALPTLQAAPSTYGILSETVDSAPPTRFPQTAANPIMEAHRAEAIARGSSPGSMSASSAPSASRYMWYDASVRTLQRTMDAMLGRNAMSR
jgi:hypothetical protein